MKPSSSKTYDVIEMARGVKIDERNTFFAYINGDQKVNPLIIRQLFFVIQTKSDKAEIWEELFPDERYDPADKSKNQKLRRLFYHLKRNLSEFYIDQALEKRFYLKDTLLLEELSRRKVHSVFSKHLNKIQKRMVQQPRRDASFFRNLYEIATLKQQYLIQKGELAQTNQYEEIDQIFDQTWILEKLAIELAKKNFEKQTPQHISSRTQEWFWAFLDAQRAKVLLNESSLHLLYTTFIDLLGGSGSVADSFDLLKRYIDQLAPENANSLFFILLNESTLQYKQSSALPALNTILDLYKWGIDRGLLFVEGTLPFPHYKNIITCHLLAKKFDEAEFYLSSLKEYLPSEEKDIYENFCKGFLYFQKGEFEKVPPLFTRLQKNVHLEIQARFLVAQSWYEIQQDIDLERYLLSLNAYIKNQKSLVIRDLNGYKNRLQFFLKLIRLNKNDQRAVEELHQQIQETRPIYNPLWLLQKTSPNP